MPREDEVRERIPVPHDNYRPCKLHFQILIILKALMHCSVTSVSFVSVSFPRVPRIKIQDKSQISFCKKLKYK